MKELSEVDWTRNNCPSCGDSGRWLHLLGFDHNDKCADICLAMVCNGCEFEYEGVIWESGGKWYEKEVKA